MEKLKTATGKEFDCDYFNPFDPARQLNIQVYGLTFAQAAVIFSDPNETVQMRYENQYASNYTTLLSMSPVGDSVRVVLSRG